MSEARNRLAAAKKRRLSLKPPTFTAAVFDFDGTLADTGRLWAEVDEIFFAERGIEYTPDVGQVLSALGFSGGAHWVKERYGVRDSVEDICDEWNRLGAALYAAKAELRPGAEAYLRYLKGLGMPLALATTNDPEVLGSIKARFDVFGFFDAVVCGHEVARPKDHPDIYLEAARRIAAEPATCAVFEDILAGTASAKRAGFMTCAVATDDAQQPKGELRELADLYIEGWEGL